MQSHSASFWSTHKRTILGLVFGLAFSATLAYAVPPGSQYTPGATLDPTCVPGSSNCSVSITTTWGSITGTLSAQTDLQSALDGKFDTPTGTTIQYIRGDGTVATVPINFVDDSYVGLNSGTGSNGTDGAGGNNIFIGNQSGTGSGTVNNAVFLAPFSGSGATNAIYSNFIGHNAGYAATDSYNANFIGRNAGNLATNAAFSVFVGLNAGQYATNADSSTFLGADAGNGAANATQSVFIGNGAGQYFTTPTPLGTENAANAIFIGRGAGATANDVALDNTATYDEVSTFANTSILVGHRTSTGGFSNSIALGAYATNTGANQLAIGSTTRKITSVFIGSSKGTASTSNTFFAGDGAGLNASGASGSVFIGLDAGTGATNALVSNFLGNTAGSGATNAEGSNFIGSQAGFGATGASNSNFMGGSAGAFASSAPHSNFFGANAGSFATNAANAVFIGRNAGWYATNASLSVFIGYRAGGSNGSNPTPGAVSATNSIFIGQDAGYKDSVNNTGNADDYSILIGKSTATGGFSNSIALGGSATNTASNQFMIGSTTRPIDTTRINGSASTQCTITTGTGIACTSDERLKTDIADLPPSTLDTLLNVRTVTYHWLQNPHSPEQIGFLAQDLEHYFPQLVSTDKDGYKSVYYAQITPILVEAIREMNLKITDIGDLTKDNSWRSALTTWFASASNGIGDFFSKKIHTDTLCVKKSDGSELCLDGDQLERVFGSGTNVIITPTPDPTPAPTDQSAPQEGIEEAPVVEPTPQATPETPTPDPAPTEPAVPEISPAQ